MKNYLNIGNFWFPWWLAWILIQLKHKNEDFFKFRLSESRQSSDILDRLSSLKPKLDEVEAGLFIGNLEAATDLLSLEQNKITHIVTVGSDQWLPLELMRIFKYFSLYFSSKCQICQPGIFRSKAALCFYSFSSESFSQKFSQNHIVLLSIFLYLRRFRVMLVDLKDSLVYTVGFIFQVDSVPLPRVLTSLLPRLRSLHLKVGWRGGRGRGEMLIIIRLPTRSLIVVTD